MTELGKILVVVGIILVVVGALMWLGWGRWMGKLPGDIAWQKGSFSFYFPLVTSLILSAILTLIFWLLKK